MIFEAFKTQAGDPSTLLWANGTTDKRFDIVKNHFVDPMSSSEASKIDFARPLYLTNDIPYLFKYVSSHVTKDFDVDKTSWRQHTNEQWSHGLVVFVKLKPNVNLFDFTDPNDYAEVFTGIDDPAQFASIFKGIEPYFAFNSGLSNTGKAEEPIEFSIAKRIALFFKSPLSPYKDDGSVKKSFFTGDIPKDVAGDKKQKNTFIYLFKTADDSTFSIDVTPSKYNEMLSFYNEVLKLGNARLEKSKTGRDQLVTADGNIWKIYPEKLSDSQLSKVNCYMKLLKFCVKHKDELLKNYVGIQDILDNADPKKRIGFSDLLQACLGLAISQSKKFQGFYCPEYVGSKLEGLSNSAPAIALFTRNAIEEVKNYPFRTVQLAIDYARSKGIKGCNESLVALRDGIGSYEERRKEEQQKKQQEQQKKEQAIASGKFIIDDNYLKSVQKLCGSNYDMYKQFKPMFDQHKGQYTTMSPNAIVNKMLARQREAKIQDLQRLLAQAKHEHNKYNIARLTDELNKLQGKKTMQHNGFRSGAFDSLKAM